MRTAVAIIAAIAGGLALFFALDYSQAPAAPTARSTSASYATSTAPWPPEYAHLRARLAADGLPALSSEGTVLHIHQHLDLFIDGAAVPVPANIGVDEAEGFISPVHTHDTTGVIHVESPVVAAFTLGEFFDVWGVRFTSECLGAYCNSETQSLRAYVNGERYQGDLRAISLTSHEEITLIYGTATETPATIPSSYAFPAGE